MACGLETAELGVEGADPVRHHAVGDVPDHSLLGCQRHFASARVRRSLGSEDGLVNLRWIVSSLYVGGIERVKGPVGPDNKGH